jgi:hypothetical protein
LKGDSDMATPNIITQIITGVKTAWTDVENFIDGEAAKVVAVLPSSAVPGFNATISDLKQGASDALGTANTVITGGEPALVTAIEGALDTWLATATGGATLALNPLINSGLTDGAGLATSAVSAWLLKAQAALATNTPAVVPAAPGAGTA